MRCRRAQIDYVDAGVSGGVWGGERGYCLMIGGAAAAVARLDPVFKTLAPGADAAPATAGRRTANSTADQGYLHCGPAGAGHFVKMVHNGIEYALMEAYAEGFNILAHANAGAQARPGDAETSPMRDPDRFQYTFARAGDCRTVAPRQRHRIVAAGSDRASAGRTPRPSAVLRTRF